MDKVTMSIQEMAMQMGISLSKAYALTRFAKKQAEAENEFRQLGMKEDKVKFKKMG